MNVAQGKFIYPYVAAPAAGSAILSLHPTTHIFIKTEHYKARASGRHVLQV